MVWAFHTLQKWWLLYLDADIYKREVQYPGGAAESEIWHICSHLCKASTRGEVCPANPSRNICIHLYSYNAKKRAGLSAHTVKRQHVPFFKNSSSNGRGNKTPPWEEKGVNLSFQGEGTKNRAVVSQTLCIFWWLQEDDGTYAFLSWSNRSRRWL